MNKEKLLEIGAEGGSLAFYALKNRAKPTFIRDSNEEQTYKSFREMILSYTSNQDPLLWYHPVEIHPEIVDELIPILLTEYQNHDKDFFMNLDSWEEKLHIRFAELSGIQTFKITPVVKNEKYSFNSFGEERVLDSITTEYWDRPEYKTVISGIGTFEGNSFIIRNKDAVILGVYPLERYEVSPIKE